MDFRTILYQYYCVTEVHNRSIVIESIESSCPLDRIHPIEIVSIEPPAITNLSRKMHIMISDYLCTGNGDMILHTDCDVDNLVNKDDFVYIKLLISQ